MTDDGWQRYHGMLLSFQRRSAEGLAASANYTWSTCRGLINQGGTPLNVGTGYLLPISFLNPPSNVQELLAVDEGPCSNSPRHIFNMTASVETPQFSNTAARVLGSGWRLSGIFRAFSGPAVTILSGADRALTGMQSQRVSVTGADAYGAKTRDNWFNAAAFAQPALGTHGNSERNGYEGMGTRVIDLSLVRSFRFAAEHRIEARIEAFNALNWFRPDLPVDNLSSPQFGRYIVSGDPRVMQFALKYSFQTRRQPAGAVSVPAGCASDVTSPTGGSTPVPSDTTRHTAVWRRS